MTLLDWVRLAVREMGTQKEAAAKTGISYSTLQRILTGESVLTLDRVGSIASAATGEAKVALDQYLKTEIARDYFVTYERAIREESQSEQPTHSPVEGSQPFHLVPLHDIAVSAGGGLNAIDEGEPVNSLGFPEAWLRNKFGDIGSLRIVKVKGDSMVPTVDDDDLVMFDVNRLQPVDGIFVLRMNDQLMVKRVHFPSTRRVLITSDNRDYERFDRLVDLERDDTLTLLGRVVWAGKSM